MLEFCFSRMCGDDGDVVRLMPSSNAIHCFILFSDFDYSFALTLESKISQVDSVSRCLPV